MKKILFTCLIFLYSGISILAEEDAANMLLNVSGLSEADIAAASGKKDLSLYDFYALSVRRTEKLLIAGENVIQSDSRRWQAIGEYLPKLSLNASKPIPNGSTSTGGSGPVTTKTYAYIYGRQPIMTGLSEWSGISQTKSLADLNRNTLVYTVHQQLLSIAQSYYLVCQLKSDLAINKEILDLYKKNRAELAHRVAVGKNRQNDLLRTDTQISKLEAQSELNNAQLATAMRQLATDAGLTSEFTTTGSVVLPAPLFKRDDLRAVAAKRVEVSMARLNVEVASLDVNAAMGEHLPTVYLEGNYRLYPNTAAADKFYGAITASMPLFSGGTTTAKVSQARSVKRQAELALAQTIRLAEEDISNAYENWDSSVKQTESFKKAFISAEKIYNFTLNDYRLNLVTILDVISSLADLQGAKSDYQTSVLTAELNRIRLGVAIEEFSNGGISLLKDASVHRENR